MLARTLALLTVASIGIAEEATAIVRSARAAAIGATSGRLHALGRGNTGQITQSTANGLIVDFRDGSSQVVEFRDVWRVRQAIAINEPEGTIVIDFARNRLFVAARFTDVIAAIAGKVPLTKFTAPNGRAVYLSAAKVIDVSNAFPALHNPLSKSVIRTSDSGQQVQEPAAAARRIIEEARARQ